MSQFTVYGPSGFKGANSPEEAIREATRFVSITRIAQERGLALLRAGATAQFAYGFTTVAIVPKKEGAQ